MTVVREGGPGGSTNTRQAGRLVPPPSIGETAAATRISPVFSPAHSMASPSRTALCHGNPEPNVEASVDRSPGSLTHHRPISPFLCIGDKSREPHGGEGAPASVASLSASSPACFKLSRAAACDATDPKPEPEVEGSAGRNTETLAKMSATGGRHGRFRNHEPHGSEVAIVSSSVAPSVDKEQRRLPTRIDSAKSSHIPENIRLQITRKNSQQERGGADSAWRDPQVSGKKDEVSGHQYWQTGADSAWRAPQVSEKKDEVSDHQYWQTDTVSSRISSARDSKLELVDASEDGNRSEKLKKPLAVSPRKPIKFNLRRHPSMLNRRGALDATSESRLPQVSAPEGDSYTTTLGPGGAYGYPHPPPFYRCEVCKKETAFYMLKCCYKVVCECCGCACESTEAGKKRRSQNQREKLPKVKLEGSDLFLWQPCSFPRRHMLWMAKRTGNHLHYYFAPIEQLMNPKADHVDVCVYDFCQQGYQVISLNKIHQRLARNLLRL